MYKGKEKMGVRYEDTKETISNAFIQVFSTSKL
jgi:hypothetical protein